MSATKITKYYVDYDSYVFEFSNENGNVELILEGELRKTAYMESCLTEEEEVAEGDLWEEPSEFNARVGEKAKEIIAIICDVFANETKYSSQLPFQQELNYNFLVVDVYGIPVVVRKNDPNAEELFESWKKMHDEGLGVQYYDEYPEDDPPLGM